MLPCFYEVFRFSASCRAYSLLRSPLEWVGLRLIFLLSAFAMSCVHQNLRLLSVGHHWISWQLGTACFSILTTMMTAFCPYGSGASY